MYSHLLSHIRRFLALNEEEEQILVSHLSKKTFSKKEHILEFGQICQAKYFVDKGCMRLYMVNESGSEQTIHFAIEHWWMTDYFSFETQKPSHFYIQAIEDVELVVLDKNKMADLFEKLPSIERYFRIVAERAYAASLMRIQYIFTLSGEERYRFFSQSQPDFVQRVPQYMLASYLGFTPEFLSKIRAKKI
jgi:CRP/FNR family transcriptional regulator